jgi:hypothetical protein
MASGNRLLLVGLLSAGIGAATVARSGNQLFEGSWTVKAQGNECSTAASGASPGPYCGNGGWESYDYSAFGMPQGIQCSPNQPRCPFASTPTDGAGVFAPLGGRQIYALFCAPWANWQGYETSVRPAKGNTAFNTKGAVIPPRYRNPAFFTSGGQPNTTFCTGVSRGATPGGKGMVQAGPPVAGKWGAVTTGAPGIGGFTFAAAPAGAAGVRTTGQVGEFAALYIYSYTYATLRNDAGVFGPGKGPGSFSLPYTVGANTVARVVVKQGAAKFGGTMRMLGQLTTKVYYCTPFSTRPSCTNYLTVSGSRFPWTTGSVTVTAIGRGPHKTVHYAKGYDNRTPTSGKGTIQMVSPVLTRWLQPAVNFETGGDRHFAYQVRA